MIHHGERLLRRRRADRHLYPGRPGGGGDRRRHRRLTVFTTESVVDQSILTFNPSMVNLDIFLNAATSGMEDISAISIPAKSLEITYNTVLNPGMWSTLYLAVIPLGVLIGGLAYWIKRRKL